MKIIYCFILSVMLCYPSWAKSVENIPKYQNIKLDFETRAIDLINRMTLEEKISQVAHSAPAIPRLGISQYNWWNECLHGVAGAGVATVFPQAIGMAASFDTNLMFQVADVISTEARAKHHEFVRNKDFGRLKGLTFWSPNINIFRDPRWGRGQETYGEDPYLSGQMGMQFVKGLQGNDPKYFKVVATAKHYAVHSGPEAERHTFNVTPNSRDLWETYLPAFYDLMVKSKAYSIMGAYNRVDGESASASWMLLEDILRGKWGFDGFVVSDCGAIWDIVGNHKIVNTPQEAAAIGVRRGCDLNCGDVYQKHLKKAVEQGLINETEIDIAVYRLMLARMKLGMFDPQDMVKYAQIPYDKNNTKEHDELALRMAEKSIVLLRNDGILPLDMKRIKEIAVVGPNAMSEKVLLGNYNGLPSNPITLLRGIQNGAQGKIKVTYNKACPLVTENAIGGIYQIVEGDFLSTIDNKRRVSGVRAEYYIGNQLEGQPHLVRTEDEVNHNWGNDGPTDTEVARGIITESNKIPLDNFAVKWTGRLTPPESGLYKLGVLADDDCQLYVNGELFVDTRDVKRKQPAVKEIKLEKNKGYEFTIEYHEQIGEASAYLIWERPITRQRKASGESFQVANSVIEQVKRADVAIFVAGLDAQWEGEELNSRVGIEGFYKGDRTSIQLPAIQLQTIRELQKTGTPIILVAMTGSAISFDGLESELSAIIQAWYPGQRGGDAVSNVIFGGYNPAGRLPVTFYKNTDELPEFGDYNMTAKNGQTYRYFKKEPLYPFGYGLSYTKFDYSNLTVDKSELTKDDKINISVTIKNAGNLNGEEVVQLYVKDVASDKSMPIKQLRGFKRVSIDKGRQQIVNFSLNVEEDMRYYDAFHQKYMVEPGEFIIEIGASSQDIRVRQNVMVK